MTIYPVALRPQASVPAPINPKIIELNPSQWTSTVPPMAGKDIVEKYAEGYAKHHPGSTSYKPSFLSKLKPSWLKTPEFMKKLADWGSAPITESKVYQGIASKTQNGLTGLAEKSTELAAKNAGVEGFIPKTLGKVAGWVGSGSNATKGFLSKMGDVAGVSKLFTKGNVALAGLFEASDVAEAYREGLGRGVAQTVQSTTKAGLGLAGSAAAITGAISLGVISGPVGLAALAIGAVGGIAGYVVGDKATSFLGKNEKGFIEGFFGKNKEQVAANHTQQHGPVHQFGTMTASAHNSASVSMPFDPTNMYDPYGDISGFEG